MNRTGSGAPVGGGGAHGPGQPCPSDLALDAWIAGHVAPEERERIETAVAQCRDCGERVAALRAHREAFLASPAARHVETRLLARARARSAAPAPFWRRWQSAFVGVGLVAGAALALVLALGSPWGPAGDPASDGLDGRAVIGVKGGAVHLETFVRRGDAVLRLGAGDAVQPGDAIGFRVSVQRDAWVVLFGTDGSAPVAIVPREGEAAHRVRAGAAAPLPASAVLDGAGDEERFALVSCPESFPVAAARDALASWAGTGDNGETADAVRRTIAPACAVRLVTFPKP